MTKKVKNKTCGECRYFEASQEKCLCEGKNYWSKPEFDACTAFTPKAITNGDKIRQGGNIELFIYWQKNKCSVCAFNEKKTCSQLSCWDGMMEWLNAPAESEGDNE